LGYGPSQQKTARYHPGFVETVDRSVGSEDVRRSSEPRVGLSRNEDIVYVALATPWTIIVVVSFDGSLTRDGGQFNTATELSLMHNCLRAVTV